MTIGLNLKIIKYNLNTEYLLNYISRYSFIYNLHFNLVLSTCLLICTYKVH